MAAARKPAVLKDFLLQLETRLKQRGVIKRLRSELVDMAYMRATGSKDWWTNYASNMLPFTASIGIAIGALFGLVLATETRIWLVEFCAASAATMIVIALPTRVTALGRYIVWSALQHHPDLKTAPATDGVAVDTKALGRSIALYGPDALADGSLAWIPALLAHIERTD
jgi:hypothetical protein